MTLTRAALLVGPLALWLLALWLFRCRHHEKLRERRDDGSYWFRCSRCGSCWPVVRPYGRTSAARR